MHGNTLPQNGDAVLVDADGALELLGWPPVRKSALYRLTRERKIPAVRIGRRYFFSPIRLKQLALGELDT